MTRILPSLLILIAAAFAGGCSTTSATSGPGAVLVPTPPEVKQYSDFLVGRYAYLTNDPELAASSARRAALRAPTDGFLLERAVTFLLLAGETEQAISMANAGKRRVSELGSVTRLAIASDEFRNGRYKEARFRLSQGNMDPFNRMIASSMSAWAAVGEGDTKGAKTHLVEAFIGDNLFDGVNLYMLAFVQEASGEDEEALKLFDAVWTERMRLAIAAEQYSRLLAANGQTEKALSIVRQFREEIGPNPSVDRIAQAIEAGDTIEQRSLTPKQGASLALYALGAALLVQTDADFASAYFELALHINPDFDLARTMLGNTLDQADRRDEAVTVLENIEADSPFFAAARGQLAWVLLRMNKDEEALETASDAYDVTMDRDLAIQIGDLNRAIQNYEAAYEWFNRVVELDESEGRLDWRSYYARGLALDALGRWNQAEADFLKSIEISPNQPEVLNHLGYSWVDRGVHLEKAFKYIQTAVELSPHAGHIVDSLGWAYYRLGRYDKAVEHLEDAVALAAGDPTINDHLGDAYWRSGRHLEAGFQWKHALDVETDETRRAVIKAKLKYGLDVAMNPEPPLQTADAMSAGSR